MEEATNKKNWHREKYDNHHNHHGKPPRKGLAFPTREKEKDAAVSQSSSSFVQDVKPAPLDDFERDTGDFSDLAITPRGFDSSRSSDSETSTSSRNSISSAELISSIQNIASLRRGFLKMWGNKSMRRLSSFSPLGVTKLSRWRKDSHHGSNSDADSELCFYKPSWRTFTILELRNATNDFSPENLIAEGGFAEVYEGQLEDGQLVAVKRLNKGPMEDRTNTFLAELGILVHINHPNIAKLIGVVVEGGLHLVLRLSPHGSLSSILHGSKKKLEWGVRYRVAIGTAEGLEYLHERCQRRIIHRDIKAANVLLTEDFEPEICDFGLAKWLPDQLSHHTICDFEGTFGYLAPEYLTNGTVDEKTDIFAFGVLLLELISGRRALDDAQNSLVMWAKPLIEKNKFKELVDPILGDSYDYDQLNTLTETASLCIQHSAVLRPRIGEVLTMLKGDEGREDDPNQMPLRRRTYSEELNDAEEYNATRYLSDLNRHKQIALGVSSDNKSGEGD